MIELSLLFLLGLHSRFGGLEPDAAVGPVAKRLIHARSAATQGKCRLASEVILVSVCVYQFDRSFRSLYSIGTIWSNRNLDLSHRCLHQNDCCSWRGVPAEGKKITRGAVLRRRPVEGRQGTVELQVLVDHALVVVAVACPLVGPVRIRTALLAILCKFADG